MKHTFIRWIDNELKAFQDLAKLQSTSKEAKQEKIELDFSHTQFFSANLTAILGAILNQLQDNLCYVDLSDNSTIGDTLKTIFQKNEFLSNFGNFKVIHDIHQTAIKYKKFKATEDQDHIFLSYLKDELFLHPNHPIAEGNETLRREILRSLLEIFANARIHGESEHIFSCGQMIPKKNMLYFTVADLGKTIKVNVNDFLGRDMDSLDSIEWALEESHSTKSKTKWNSPGGLGLSNLRTFIEKSNGVLQIVSADGFWESKNMTITKEKLNHQFQGTIVNIGFNLLCNTSLAKHQSVIF